MRGPTPHRTRAPYAKPCSVFAFCLGPALLQVPCLVLSFPADSESSDSGCCIMLGRIIDCLAMTPPPTAIT